MDRDRELPELEIELLAPGVAPARERLRPAHPGPNRDRPRLVVAAIVAVAALVVAFALIGDDEPATDPASPPTSSAPAVSTRSAPVTATTAATTTIVWKPPPALLGVSDTKLLLWSFDSNSRLQWVDLDSGEVRHLNPRGGDALLPLDRGLIVNYASPASNGPSTVINASGDVLQPALGGFGYPVPVLGTTQVWVQTPTAPRHWQLHRPGPGIILVLPPEAATTVVHYSARTALLVTPEGTSSFDVVTRQRQLLTTTSVILAGGRWMIGRTCSGDRCTLTAIDFESGSERVLRTDVPRLDLQAPTLSPDGRYLVITGKSLESGRYAEIIDVATSLAAWRSPDGVSFTGVGPAWSWSPDSTRFFVTMSASHVIAVDVREQPFRQTEIAMPHKPFHGIAVTLR